jgi:hypothetical protein
MKKSKLLLICSGFLILVNIIIYATKLGGDQVLLYISDLLPVVCALIAVIGLFNAFKSFKNLDFIKKAWLMILIGIVSYLIAETIYFVMEVMFNYNMNEIFPSLADIFWCFGYIPLIAGLSMMLFGYYNSDLPMGNIKLYSLLSFLILVIFGLVVLFILIPITKDPETSLLTKISSLFYPIADVIVVIPALILMYITSLFGSGAVSKPWKYLAVSFICFAIADLLYSYLSWQGTYGSGNLIDVFWNAGYLFIALSGIYQMELIETLKENAAK